MVDVLCFVRTTYKNVREYAMRTCVWSTATARDVDNTVIRFGQSALKSQPDRTTDRSAGWELCGFIFSLPGSVVGQRGKGGVV